MSLLVIAGFFGGLMALFTVLRVQWHRTADQIDRILDGVFRDSLSDEEML